MWRSALTASLLAAFVLTAAPRADIRTSKKDAALLREKVATITAHGKKNPPGPPGSRQGINEYTGFMTRAVDYLPDASATI